MSDRELLELAAKAAAIEGEYSENIGEDWGRYSGKAGIAAAHGRCWNPLTDDGDALRLAVKLRINLHHGSQWIEAIFDQRKESVSVIVEYFKTEEHRLEATRRVIVRAAAELGSALE